MASALTAEVIAFCDDLLDSASFDDWSPNGLQVFGTTRTEVVVTGVSARLELFERAAELGAGLVIAHHGILHGAGGPIDRLQGERLKGLLLPGIALAQDHLPLDAHPTIGNNALLAEGWGRGRRALLPRPGIRDRGDRRIRQAGSRQPNWSNGSSASPIRLWPCSRDRTQSSGSQSSAEPPPARSRPLPLSASTAS